MLKRLKEVGGDGKLKILECTAFILIGAFNLIGILKDNESLLNNAEYWLPFFIMVVVIYLYSNKYLSASIYFILSVFISLLVLPNEDLSNFSGAIFYIFAFHQIKKIWAGFVILLATSISIMTRAITVGDTGQGIVTMFVVYFFVYGIYWVTIYHPDKKLSFSNLDKEENKLLELMAEGLSQKEAGAVLGLDQSQANNYVKKIKRKTDSETLNQIMFKYGSINSNK